MLGEIIQWIGYEFIMDFSLVIGYFLLDAMHSDISPFLPMTMYAIMSYIIGMLFMNVFGLAVDTCLQCFTFAEKNQPDGIYIPGQLKGIMDNGARTDGKEEAKIRCETNTDPDKTETQPNIFFIKIVPDKTFGSSWCLTPLIL